jgi:hypothetical protein
MIIGNKNSNHGILVDSVSVSTTKQVKTIYDMSKLKSLQEGGFPKNEWVYDALAGLEQTLAGLGPALRATGKL